MQKRNFTHFNELFQNGRPGILNLWLQVFSAGCKQVSAVADAMRDALPYTHHAVDGVGAQQDKQTKVICRTSTGASSVNLARPKMVAILSH